MRSNDSLVNEAEDVIRDSGDRTICFWLFEDVVLPLWTLLLELLLLLELFVLIDALSDWFSFTRAAFCFSRRRTSFSKSSI